MKKNVNKSILFGILLIILLSSSISTALENSRNISTTAMNDYPAIEEISGGIAKVKVKIKNFNTPTMYNVTCTIKVRGGILAKIDFTEVTVIDELDSGESATIETETPIFGLGKIKIDVEADNNGAVESDYAYAYVIFIFVIMR